MKSHLFVKCFHLIFLYIIGYNMICHGDPTTPHDPHQTSGGRNSPSPTGLTPIWCQGIHLWGVEPGTNTMSLEQ